MVGQWTERHISDCVCCGGEIDEERHDAHVEVTMSDAETDLLSMIIAGDVTADDLRSVKKLWGVIRDRPKLGEELDELIEKTEQLVDDEKSNAFGGIGAYATIAAGGLMAAGQRAAAAWGRAKDKGMRMHPEFEHYPNMSMTRKVGLAGVLGLLFMLLFISWWMDLNPTEGYWKRLKQALGNRYFGTLGEIRSAVWSALETIDPPRVYQYLCL